MHRVLDSRINDDQTLRTVYNSYTYTLFASVNMSKYFRTLVSGDDKLFHQLQHINAVQNVFVDMANIAKELSRRCPQVDRKYVFRRRRLLKLLSAVAEEAGLTIDNTFIFLNTVQIHKRRST